jgi:hypothetical protein
LSRNPLVELGQKAPALQEVLAMSIPLRAFRAALLTAAVVAATPSLAQTVLIPGSLRGFGSAGPTGTDRLCSPLAIGLYEWRIDWVARQLRPTDAQAALLRDLAERSANARHIIADACRNGELRTTTDQLAVMERRIVALNEALQTIRPSYEAFYSALAPTQRARLDGIGPARRGWGW